MSIIEDPNLCYTIKCYDDDNPVAPTHRPRGYAGVAIIWQKEIAEAVKVLPDGSSRLVAIQVQTEKGPIVIINTYMPSEGSLDTSCSYSSLLDEVYEVTRKYSSTSIILWTGDLNASFNRPRKTSNDKLFIQFCKEMNLKQPECAPPEPTYHHFSGKASSKIDHFIQLDHQVKIINHMKIDARHAMNCSTHDSIMAELSLAASIRK